MAETPEQRLDCLANLLLARRGLWRLGQFLTPIGSFEEIPIRTRVSQADRLGCRDRDEADEVILHAAIQYYSLLTSWLAIRVPPDKQADWFVCITLMGVHDRENYDYIYPSIFYSQKAREIFGPPVLSPASPSSLGRLSRILTLRPHPCGLRVLENVAEPPELQRYYIGYPDIPGAGFMSLCALEVPSPDGAATPQVQDASGT